MAQQSFVEDGFDRVQEAFRNAGGEIEKFQKELAKRRKQFEKDTQKRVKKFQTDLRKQPIVKRVETIQKDATKQVENAVDSMLSALQIASQSDLKRIDRKLSQLTRKLNAIEKTGKA